MKLKKQEEEVSNCKDKSLRHKWSIMCLLILWLPLEGNERLSLVNKEFIRCYMNKEAPWASSHGAADDYLGTGMLYYALVYAKKARLCVCLGSGGGFVPRIMRQAQRDLGLEDAKTILVDANIGGFGTPSWIATSSFFRSEFPEIEIIIDFTACVAINQGKDWKIDYLHIDADRTFKGAYQDFIDYLPLMARQGVITFHDTHKGTPCSHIIKVIRQQGYEVVDFNTLGNGVAIIYLP